LLTRQELLVSTW